MFLYYTTLSNLFWLDFSYLLDFLKGLKILKAECILFNNFSTTEEPSSSLSSTNKFNNSESRNNYHLTNGPIKCEEKNSSPNFKKRKVKSLYTSKSKLKAKTKKLNTDNSKKLPRDINKKSGTGETYLHHACIKVRKQYHIEIDFKC